MRSLSLVLVIAWLFLCAVSLGTLATDGQSDGFDAAASASGEAGEESGEGFDEEGEPEISEEKMKELMERLGRGGGMDPFGMDGRRYTRDIPAVEEDVPHILCQTCEALVDHVQSRLDERRKRMKKTKVTEYEILEMLETICDPLAGEGEWITHFDIVERDDKLVLENKGHQGHCEEECKTMVMACDNIVKESDSDIAEVLYANKPDAKQKICTKIIGKMKGACSQPPIPIRADRVPGGDNFKSKSDIDIALHEAGKELRHKQQINPDFLRDEM